MGSKIKKLFVFTIAIFSFSFLLTACGDTGGGGAPKTGGAATKESREAALQKLGSLQDESQKDDTKKK